MMVSLHHGSQGNNLKQLLFQRVLQTKGQNFWIYNAAYYLKSNTLFNKKFIRSFLT